MVLNMEDLYLTILDVVESISTPLAGFSMAVISAEVQYLPSPMGASFFASSLAIFF
jgi:ABC-type anion transport system duplicated permease subunit